MKQSVFIIMALVLALISAKAQTNPTIDQVGNQSAMEDAAEQTILLTGITDGDGGGQTLTIDVTSDSQALFSKLEITAGATDTSLVYQPASDASGSAAVTVSVTDTDGTTYMEFEITVTPVNDPPTIDPHADVTINEDAGIIHVTLTGISGGPADEDQGLGFTMYSSNPSVVDSMYMNYSTGDSEATLDITINPDSVGTSNMQIQVLDELYSNLVTIKFNLFVQPVNDAPYFNPIDDDVIENDAAEHTIPLSGITEGPANESDQTLTFDLTNDNNTLLTNLSIDYSEGLTTGSLRYTPTTGEEGVANITVRLSDDGGVLNGGSDYLEHTFKIIVNNTVTLVSPLKANRLILYPNPVSNVLKVTLPESATGESAVSVYSASGEKVLGKSYSGRLLNVPVSTLTIGWYQIKVMTNDGVYSGHFMVK